MNKKELSTTLKNLWAELNSNIPKEQKLAILLRLEQIVTVNLKFDEPSFNSLITPCLMVIEEFRSFLDVNPNYIDTMKPSSLMYFLLAVKFSSLQD